MIVIYQCKCQVHEVTIERNEIKFSSLIKQTLVFEGEDKKPTIAGHNSINNSSRNGKQDP
jgi:hypothetical protein